MKEKQTKRREIRDDEIAKSSQSHSSERRRGVQVRQTKWEERETKEERTGRREDVPVQDGGNIRSDVDVKSERKLAQSQNDKEKTRDGEGERGGDTGG